MDIADNAVITPRVISRELTGNSVTQATGQPLSGFSRTVLRDDRVRETAHLTLTSNNPNDPQQGVVHLGAGAKILADDKATVSLSASNRVEVLGEVRSAGGTVNVSVPRGAGTNYLASAGVWLGSKAIIDVSGQARTFTDSQGLTQGTVLNGGTVTLDATNAYVVAKQGSQIKLSGAAPVVLGQRNESGGLGRSVGSDAGTLTVSSTEGVLLESSLAAKGGSGSQRGGQLNINLAQRAADQTGTFPTTERGLTLGNASATHTANLAVGDAVPDALNGNVHLGLQAVEAAGFDRVNLAAADVVVLENGLDVGANRARPLRELGLSAARFETRGGDVTLRADALRFANPLAASSVTAPTSAGSLTADARQIEFVGDTAFSGMATATFNATEAIRLSGQGGSATPSGSVKLAADAVFHAAVVAPSTATRFTVEAVGKRIEFSRNTNTPTQPLSALGSLAVKAGNIVQGGNLWVPLGQFDFQASNKLEFKDGSLTSVAAKPDSLLPYGRIENGKTWAYGAPTADTDIKDLPEKSIRTQAASIDMQPGAKIDLSGGGDLQAYEFTVGPGGSKDILADKNTYAILPGYTGGFAPADAQEGFDRPPGEAVYLSGVPDLKDGVYTLLPAHYALLPDAYAVKLDSGLGSVLPGQAYSRQDGVRIAAGYVTDSRANAPRDANWQGVQVMTRDQVRARSEFTLTRASQFFADSRNRPQDAGLLSVSTSGSGVDALKLDATYNMAAAAGGRGAQVDISALKLAVTSGTPAGIDSDAVVLDAARLNALGADSLLIGGTRSRSGDTTTLAVGATSVTLANDAANALKGSEVMLASTDTLTLKAGSAIDAQGASGDAGHYQTAGNGAFVRAASTSATLARTGSPNQSTGRLVGEAGSRIVAADSITLDATQNNAYTGTTRFEQPTTVNGVVVRTPVDGNLAVGATRISFGAAPAGSEGLTYTQADLDAIDLTELSLISYSTFDLYGDVVVGRKDAAGRPVLQNLSLQGAGLAGIGNAGLTAQLNAKNLTLSNPTAAAFNSPKDANGNALALGSGNLAGTADTLTLGQGTKAIQGFSGGVSVTANELVAATGTGKLDVNAPLTLNVARISGARGADQSLNSTAALTVAQHTADRVLAPVTALGAKWAMQGSSVNFDSLAELPSGHFKLTATNGDVKLGANARVDVAGRAVKFFDVEKPSWGGTAEFVSDTGNVEFSQGSSVDVSAAAGGDAGTLIVRATNGSFTVANGSVQGQTPADAKGTRGEGARAQLDVGSLAGFADLNTALNSGGFDSARDLRVRTGDVSIADTDEVRVHDIRIAADGGKLDVAGTLDASGTDAGRIELWAKGDVNLKSTAKLAATSSGAQEDGGDVVIGTHDGEINLAASDTDKGIYVSGGTNGQNGTVLLRAPRINGDTDVAVSTLGSAVTDARSVAVEAVEVYEGKTTLNATTTNSGTTLGLGAITADNTAFAAHHAAIRTRLNRPDLNVLSGVEIRSVGDMTLGADWNLATARAGGEVGVLTLRAGGNLKLNNNLSDGFDVATPQSGTTPATLQAGKSWTYRLVGGAEAGAANPLSVVKGAGNVDLAAGKLVRTGTGDIHLTAGSDIKLGSDKSAIYTAGRVADALPAGSGFTVPTNAQFSQGGGDIHLTALGDIVSAQRSRQLYSNWLFRQGQLNAAGDGYTTRPAWWVRFDQFQQGIGALGGGNVTLTAGGKVENVSASTPTQARMDSAVPDATKLVTTGGGDVRVETGGDVLGGQYYADRGAIRIRAGGALGEGEKVSGRSLYTILALADSQATVQTHGDLNLHAIINPHLVVQTSGSGSNVNIANAASALNSLFSTYSETSAATLESLAGKVDFRNNAPSGSESLAVINSNTAAAAYGTPLLTNVGSYGNFSATRVFALMPATLDFTAFQSDVRIGGAAANLTPSPQGGLSLLAANQVSLLTDLKLLDMAPLPDAVRPVLLKNGDFFVPNPATAHAVPPVHLGDTLPVRVYAVNGNVEGRSAQLSLTSPKAVRVKAGQDVKDLGLSIQHADSALAVSKIEAGRDVVFSAPGSGDRAPNAYIRVGGEGRLEVSAGRNIDLGVSAGIVSRGNLDNPALPTRGANIELTAGTGAAGADYVGAVDRLLDNLRSGTPDEKTLWLARWLTGNTTLDSSNALSAVEAVDTLSIDAQRGRVRDMLYTALQTTGREFRNPDSAFAGDYSRGYAALELLFPGIEARNTDGSFKHYQGDIDLFASRVLTERGGDIEFLTPGGKVIVGLANTTEKQLATETPSATASGQPDNGVLGLAVLDVGAIRGASRGDMLVNQSRILTVGGGDISLWSSEGDIDAGKGKKSASVVPPPVILVDKDGNTSLILPGAASGSGIGALEPAGGPACGTTRCVVDLIAPRGTVNAGDAGIRAGNLNIAAQVVLGADNISVSGNSSGTPVADTSAVSAASSGATTAGNDVSSTTAALAQNLSEAARAAENLKNAFKPTFISAEVIGHGE